MERRTRAPAPSTCSIARKTLRIARAVDMLDICGVIEVVACSSWGVMRLVVGVYFWRKVVNASLI